MDETIKVKKAEVLLAVLLLLYLTSVLSLHDLLSQTSHHCDAAWRALPTHWPKTNPAVMARI